MLPSERNVTSVRKKCCLRQRETFLHQRETSLHQRETLLASERNSLSIGIPSLFLLFLSNYLHGEKYFSAWREILFSMETRIFLRRDNSIPSVEKVTRTIGNPTPSPLLPSPLGNKNPQSQGNDGPTLRRPRNNSANPIMVDCRFIKQRC